MGESAKGGCFVSQSVGFILLLLAVCLSVLVGLIVHLASPTSVTCICDNQTPEVVPAPSSAELQQQCVKFVADGSTTICKACDKRKTTIPTSEPTPETTPSTKPITTSTPEPTPETSPQTTTEAPIINYRLPRNVIPQHYVLHLQPDIYGTNSSEFTFNGTVVIDVNVTTSTSVITMHQFDLVIDEYYLYLMAGSATTPVITATTYDNKTQFYQLHLDRDLEAGLAYKIGFVFRGKMRTDGQGLHSTSYKDGNQTVHLATTQFEAPWARSAFPCFDEPALKATFDITLYRKLNTGREYRSLSNGDLKETTIIGDYAADTFDQTPKMSTYLLAFIVCDFKQLENATSNITYRTLARPNMIQYAGMAHEYGMDLFDWFAQKFKPAYPISKLDNIAIPNFGAGAMENWGLITYRESILYQPRITTASREKWSIEVLSHEICHQWFGNIVTPKWWWWLWLNEAFASFWDFWAIRSLYPERKAFEQYVVQSLHRAFEADDLPTAHPLVNPVESQEEVENSFDTITYHKGAAIIRLMHFILGEDLFVKGLNFYLTRHQYSSVDHYDLLTALTETASTEGSPINMTHYLDPWITQANFPVVMVTVDASNSLKLEQMRFLEDMEGNTSSDSSTYGYKWPIPITFVSSVNTSNFGKTYTYSELNWLEHDIDFIMDDIIPAVDQEDAWVMVNQEVLYYRVNYERKNWLAIIKQMELSYETFPPINRAQIINDAWALQKSGLVTMDIALASLNFLKHDTEYPSWRAFSREISFIDRMLEKTDLYGAFRKFMRDSIQKSYQLLRMNIAERIDVPYKVFHVARSANYACKYGLQACREDALLAYRGFMENSSQLVDQNLQGLVFCNAIRYGGLPEWKFAFDLYWSDSSSDVIQNLAFDALTCTMQPWLLERMVKSVLDEKFIKKANRMVCLQDIGNNPVGRDILLNYVKTDFNQLDKKLGKSTLGTMLRNMALNYNTDYYANEFKILKSMPAAKKYSSSFEKALKKISDNTKWLNTNYESIKSWLLNRGYSAYVI